MQRIINKSSNPKLIEEVFEFAKNAYKERSRPSGENYIVHAIKVATTLDKMDLDPTTIAFGILHDTIYDVPDSARKVEVKEIGRRFGREIGNLVEKISSLSKVRYSLSVGIREKKTFTREKIENLRRMFLALSGDIRVVLVELVSRLDELDILHYLPKDKQMLYALETLQIFVPVASRLGLSEIRRNLEDTAFMYLYPDRYKWLKENIKEQYEEREKYLKKFIPYLQKIFKKERVKVLDINYRVKSYWSTYRKLAAHEMNFDKIHDLIALRIIAPDIESCYRILGIIHKHFKPLSEEIDDYIAKPKPNGYRSLHTTVLPQDGKITEIQIRTEEMQKEAEFGVCAHWSYKEKINLKKEGADFEWLKNAPDFWKTFKIDFFTNKVFPFTPRGDVIVLPKNSTPIDFAYAVHSDIGNHCESAKIGGKIVPLDHIIENGDIVEITINKNKKPSNDWLKFVRTSLAKSQIRKFTGQDRSALKFPLSIPGFIKRKISEISEASRKKRERKNLLKTGGAKQIYLAGQKGILTHIAKCCNPQPGDKIGAYLPQNRAPAILHRLSCNNLKKLAEKFPERIVEASWK